MAPPGRRRRGRPKQRWMDCVNRHTRTIATTKDEDHNRTGWRRIVYAQPHQSYVGATRRRNKTERNVRALASPQHARASKNTHKDAYTRIYTLTLAHKMHSHTITQTHTYALTQTHTHTRTHTHTQTHTHTHTRARARARTHSETFLKAKILAISSDTHQLHYIPLHHFTI